LLLAEAEPEEEEEKEPAVVKSFPVKVVPEVKREMIEYEGLQLRREPDQLEKLCDLKSMVNEQELNEERVQKILKRFRVLLIDQAVTKMQYRKAANAHMVVLESDPKTQKELAKAIRNSYATGQNQVAREIMNQKREKKIEVPRFEVKALDDDDLAYIESLTDGLVGRMINEIRTRAVNQFLSLGLLGSYTQELFKDVLMEQSEKWIDPLAGASVNAAIQSGREDEAAERKDEWDNVQYSAILDAATCEFCEDADGMEADNPDDLPDAPNPECEGQANCRCFHVYVVA